MGARGGKRRTGFYRESLRRPQEPSGSVKVDVAEMKKWLIEELRRRPGDLQLVLEAMKVMMQAEASERRSGRGKGEEIAANMQALVEGLGNQLLPVKSE